MNAWQRFWQRRTHRLSMRLLRRLRFRLGASRIFARRFTPLRCESLDEHNLLDAFGKKEGKYFVFLSAIPMMVTSSGRRRPKRRPTTRWRRLVVEEFERREMLSHDPYPVIAVSDHYTVQVNSALSPTALNLAAPGVLFNDQGAYSAVSNAPPTHGTLVLRADGSFIYTPNIDFAGLDSFVYSAVNPWEKSSGTVTINVTLTGDHPPVAVSDHFTAAAGRDLYGWINELATASDPDGDTLMIQTVDDAKHGSFSLYSDGRIDYLPAAGFTGLDSFTFRVSDGSLQSNLATVIIRVTLEGNHAPIAVNDAFSTQENTPLSLSAPGAMANDSDLDGDILTAGGIGGGRDLPKHGFATVQSDGSFTYTPYKNYIGLDSFTYRLFDRQIYSPLATITVNVTPVNQPPVVLNDRFSVAPGATVAALAPGVLGNDSDPDGDGLSANLVTGPAHGGLTLNADGSFKYSPDAGYIGLDSFSYSATDGKFSSLSPGIVVLAIGGNDQPPLAHNDHFTILWNNGLGIPAIIIRPGVLANDRDPDGDSLQASLVSGPQLGTLALQSSGNFTYVPAAHFAGLDSFTYRITDGLLTSNLATVTLDVTSAGKELLPGGDKSYGAPKDGVLRIIAPGVLSGADYWEPDTLMAQLAQDPIHGMVVVNSDGGFTYTPAAGYTGPDSFTVNVTDGQLWTYQPKKISLNVSVLYNNTPVPPGGEDPPVAHDDTFSINENGVLVTGGNTVLSNDTDSDGDALNAILATNPLHGLLSLTDRGSVRYVPDVNFFGTDSFSYFASDGQLSSGLAIATISVTQITAAAGPPPRATDDAFITAENTPLVVSASGLLANDVATNGDGLTMGGFSKPSYGTLVVNADGSLTYVPRGDFFGTDTFAYNVQDSTRHSNDAIVTITVKHANQPPAIVDDSFATSPNATLNIATPGVLTNDVDPEGDAVSAKLVAGPGHGSLTLAADGGFAYFPDAGYSGSDSFTYKASDGQSISIRAGAVLLNVATNNQPPVAANDSYGARYNSGAGIPLIIGPPSVLANDHDPGGNSLTATLVTGPIGGTVTLGPNGRFSYLPSPSFFGPDSFVYRASNGSLMSQPATVTLNIVVNDQPPVAKNDRFIVYDTGTFTVTAWAYRVLSNDVDPDGSTTLTATLVDPPIHGTLILNSDGSYSYTPADGFIGFDSFTYSVSDGQLDSLAPATAVFEVQHSNRWPVANSDGPFTINMNSTLKYDIVGGLGKGVLSNDTDVDNSTATAVFNKTTNHGALALNADGSFSYTPYTDYVGLDSFVYRAFDGSAWSGEVTVTINILPTNDAPAAVNDAYSMAGLCGTPLAVSATAGVLANDSDVDGDTLTATLVSNPSHGSLTLAADGSFTYSPSPFSFLGADSFTYRASDGQVTANLATVTVNVNGPHVPVAVNDNYIATEDMPRPISATAGVLANDTDPDCSAVLSAVLNSQPATGTVSLGSNGSFTYFPFVSFNGIDSFTYRSFDGITLSNNIGTVTITIQQVNDPPVANNDVYAATEDIPLVVAPFGVLENDSDVDNDPALNHPLQPGHLFATLVSGPLRGTVNLDPLGGFSYAPSLNFNGADSFTYRVVDQPGASSGLATVTINIASVNDSPTFTIGPDEHVNDDSGPQVVPGWAKDISPGPADEVGQMVGFSVVGNTNPGIIEGDIMIDAAGKLSFTPQPNVEGTATITVRLQDSGGTANGGIDFSEQRFVIIVDKPHRWHNGMPPLSPHDRGGLEVVFEDEGHSITPTDVLFIISYLNAGLPSKIDANAPLADGITRPFYDVDGDDSVTPTDALLIIDVLNAGQGGPVDLTSGGEGEAAAPPPGIQPSLADLIALMAYDAAEQATRRRGGR